MPVSLIGLVRAAGLEGATRAEVADEADRGGAGKEASLPRHAGAREPSSRGGESIQRPTIKTLSCFHLLR
eukprot:4275437-Pyramimonas_sp.AAC.2